MMPAARAAGERHDSGVAAEDAHFAVGVLALQGSFKEHFAAVGRQPGFVGREVCSAADLAGLDALILPGGESTAQSRCMIDAELLEPVRKFVAAGKPVWAYAPELSSSSPTG
jgi:glutamine amidotransferase PdxT